MAKFTAEQAMSCKIIDAKERAGFKLEVVVRDGDGQTYFIRLAMHEGYTNDEVLKQTYSALLSTDKKTVSINTDATKDSLIGQAPKPPK